MHSNALCNTRVIFRVLFVLLLSALLVRPLLAQTSSTAGLTGTVTDPSGSVIAGATVTATNAANGQVRTTTTGSDGVYKFTLLPPGAYNVKFEAGGFETSQVSSVQLDVTENPVLNRGLTVGSQTQQVTVEADTETIQTSTSALGTVVAPKTVTDLPLSTRNYLNLLGLSAGANMAVTNASQPGKGTVNLYVNGSNSAQNNFQMNGSIIDNYFASGNGADANFYAAIPIPNPDAIQEFKIQTSTYDAGYGRNPGANLDVLLRSGTNAFHGTAFEFFRNTILNANEFFYKRSHSSNAVLNQNQYGGTIGGPIKKNKLFFFGSYQETSQKNGLANLQTTTLPPIPSGNRGTCTTPNWTSLAQCDAATAQFATALATGISPNCPAVFNNSVLLANGKTNGTVGGIQVACPTLALTGNNGQYGPAGLYNINPVAINILQLKLANGNYYVPGSTTTPYGTNTFSIPIVYAEHQVITNADYTLNSKNTISESFVFSTNPATSPFGNNGTTGMNLPGAPVTYQYWQYADTLKLTTVVSNNLVNEVRWGFQRFDSITTNNVPFTDPGVGITNAMAPTIPTLSQIGVTAGSVGFQVGGAVLFGLNLTVTQNEFADQLSWTHGKHTFRFGGEFERDHTSINFTGLHIGNPTFPSFPDFLIGRASCSAFTGAGTCGPTNPGNTNGSTSNSNETGLQPNATLSANNSSLTSKLPVDMLSFFAQDDVKVNSTLTLNLGLRWEWYGNATTEGGQWSDIWPSLLAQQPLPGTGCVSNGVTFGLGATGTGCSLVGTAVPSNFPAAVPGGVFVNNTPYITRATPKLDNFAPRVGFAWQPLSGNSRLVVRGGGGFFYDRPNGLIETELGHSDPPYAILIGTSPLANLSNPFVVPPTIPGPSGTPGWTPRWGYLNSSGVAVTSNLSGVNTVSQDYSNGLLYEWNLDTQYQFAPTWVLELGYVGSHGIHQPGAPNLQGVATAYNMQPGNMAMLASASNPVNCGYDGNSNDCITTNTSGNLNLRVPFVGMSSQFVPATSTDQSKFNSAQVTVRKQLSHGLLLQAAYTWSRSFINYYTGNPNATAPGIQPYLDPYGPNINYRPQRLVLTYSWDLPTFGEHHGIVGQLVNGWNWAGVTTIQDGTPLLISDTRDGSAFVVTNFGPDALATLCPGVSPASIPGSGRVASRLTNFFNNTTGTFCAPQTIPGSTVTGYGNYGLGQILGPGQFNFDMTVVKTFKIRESQSLQFRSEFFNTFNHAQFNSPGTNAAQASLGQITSTSVNPRLIQFALKYSF